MCLFINKGTNDFTTSQPPSVLLSLLCSLTSYWRRSVRLNCCHSYWADFRLSGTITTRLWKPSLTTVFTDFTHSYSKVICILRRMETLTRPSSMGLMSRFMILMAWASNWKLWSLGWSLPHLIRLFFFRTQFQQYKTEVPTILQLWAASEQNEDSYAPDPAATGFTGLQPFTPWECFCFTSFGVAWTQDRTWHIEDVHDGYYTSACLLGVMCLMGHQSAVFSFILTWSGTLQSIL